MSTKNTLILMLAMSLIGIMILAGRWKCNRAAPSATTQPITDPLHDSLVIINHELKKAKEGLQEFEERIKKLESRDSMWIMAFKANRQSDEKLKVKQSGIRKQVENLSNDSLRQLINNFQ